MLTDKIVPVRAFSLNAIESEYTKMRYIKVKCVCVLFSPRKLSNFVIGQKNPTNKDISCCVDMRVSQKKIQ